MAPALLEDRPLCPGAEQPDAPGESPFGSAACTLAQHRARTNAENLLLERAIRRSLAEARRREACRRTLEECQAMQKHRMEAKQKK